MIAESSRVSAFSISAQSHAVPKLNPKGRSDGKRHVSDGVVVFFARNWLEQEASNFLEITNVFVLSPYPKPTQVNW